MRTVLQLRKFLPGVDRATSSDLIQVRTYAGPQDMAICAAIKQDAFRLERLQIRVWDEADFGHEITSKPWWRQEWCWLAEIQVNGFWHDAGMVMLGLRQTPKAILPCVHWLCVRPQFRRRGIASTLLRTLERAALESGFTELRLETHSAWRSACEFYARHGFETMSLANNAN